MYDLTDHPPELARICPDISELSVVFSGFHSNTDPSRLANARNCITALQNLSTLQIIYLVPNHQLASPYSERQFTEGDYHSQYQAQLAYKERMDKQSEDQWRELKEAAIEHLKSCSGLGPKVFRTVVVDHYGESSNDLIKVLH